MARAAVLLLLFLPVGVPAQSAGTWQRRGLELHLKNRFSEAIPAFREAVRLDSTLWTSHLFLGICFYRTNQFAAGLESLRQADRLAPASGQGRDEVDYWLGATRIALKQPIAGLKDLERLLARSPAHVDALQLATETYAALSSSLWNEVAERQLETAPGWEIHGRVMESEGNAADALDAYRRSIALESERPGPRLAIGRILLAQGKAEEALTTLREELAVAPRDAETQFYAGLAAIQLGRYAEAAASLEPAARWAGKLPEAPLALAQVYLALREPAKAAQAARQAVAVAPSSVAAHEVLLTALTQSEDSQGLALERFRWEQQQGK